MLFHASIPADQPERVARIIAELWRGQVLPFPPFSGAFMAWSGDDRRTVIDVYPRGAEHVPAPGEFGVRTNPAPSAHSESHLALGVMLAGDEVLAIAKREGWLATAADCSTSSSFGSRTSSCLSYYLRRSNNATSIT